jgi:predicted RNA-binding Zn-ribbon protein involved in translation (DUF1610 family)
MNYVLLRSFDNYIYANILLLRLKSEGIDCYIKDENIITIDPLLNPAIGGMKLMVIESELPMATKILQEVELEELKTLPCPNCGKLGIQRIIKTNPPTGFFSRLLNHLVSGGPDEENIVYRCTHCGYKTDSFPLPPEDEI